MSTSDSETPALTRRQLRELRNTGATPIITPAAFDPDAATSAPVETAESAADQAGSDEPATDDVGGHGASEAPAAEAETPAAEAAPAEPAAPVEPSTDETTDVAAPSAPLARAAAPVSFAPPLTDDGIDQGVSGLTRRQARAQEKIRTASIPVVTPDFDPPVAPAPRDDEAERSAASDVRAIFKPAPAADETDAPSEVEEPVVAVVNPGLGSELLEGATPEVTLPPSFDQLIARSATATGSISTPNALILSQTPTGAPLVAPIASTGEVLITGTFELPEGLGSIGHAPGTTDGRDADAVLLDGELPPASSPTPIAASAAISTVKQPGEIIRPPAPEKGSRLMIGLIITTGALALAVAGALILAFTTGVF